MSVLQSLHRQGRVDASTPDLLCSDKRKQTVEENHTVAGMCAPEVQLDWRLVGIRADGLRGTLARRPKSSVVGRTLLSANFRRSYCKHSSRC